jgi:LDH2 family malate/lactate/ureidoglycolate dehydrogenase
MAKPLNVHQAQIESILASWGMPAQNAKRTAEVMAWADLHGIDSHGLSMLTVYHARRNRFNLKAEPELVRETPISAVVDGHGGLGHVAARYGMELAIKKAKTAGVGIVAVRGSAHFGACGFYSKMAADAGLIGMVTTSTSGINTAPTGGAQARMGTDPISFAAPGKDGVPFLLDMATTTVAGGKIRNKANEGLQCPPGWLVTKEGKPSTDPNEHHDRGGFLTPLGGTPEGSSHKGYGLSSMVNILSTCLTGATLVTDPMHTKKPIGHDIGHFFMAIDPGMFRDPEDFKADVTTFCEAMRATKPMDPEKPVMVAGDPERAKAAERLRDGIPVAKNLLAKVRTIAQDSGVPWLLG